MEAPTAQVGNFRVVALLLTLAVMAAFPLPDAFAADVQVTLTDSYLFDALHEQLDGFISESSATADEPPRYRIRCQADGLAAVKSLRLNNRSGLEGLTNLAFLNLGENNETSVSEITGLSALKSPRSLRWLDFSQGNTPDIVSYIEDLGEGDSSISVMVSIGLLRLPDWLRFRELIDTLIMTAKTSQTARHSAAFERILSKSPVRLSAGQGRFPLSKLVLLRLFFVSKDCDA